MNMITKSALALLAASSIATVAVAAPGDATYGQITQSQAKVEALSAKIDRLGATPASDINVNASNSPVDRAHALEAKASELQLQLNTLQTQKAQ